MEKYKDSDVELMSILLKLQEQTSPIRMSIGYTVGGTVRQSPCHPVRIQALHSHPVRLFRTGGRLS